MLVFLVAFCILIKYLITLYLKRYGYDKIAFALVLGESLLYSITKVKLIFIMGFRNLIVDEMLGSTATTLITSTWYLSVVFPNTLGMKFAHYVNFDIFACCSLVLVVITFAYTYNIALELDKKDPNR